MTVACIILLLVFIGLQWADCDLTAKGLDVGLSEQNPLARWIIDRIGLWPAMISVKTALVAIVIGICWYTPYADYAFAAIFDLAYVYIVGRNYQLIRDAGE